MKKIAIIGALDEEISLIKEEISGLKEHQLLNTTFYEGVIAGKAVILVKSGVGKVLSAAVAQALCDKFDLEYIVFTGVAGAIDKDYKVGDVCIVNEAIQYDMDVTALGFKLGEIPYTNYRIFNSDKNLVEKLQSSSFDFTTHIGRVGTGDTFVSSTEKKSYIQQELSCNLIDMESAAIGQVATINKVPFVIIRSISDAADEHASVSFEEMLPVLAIHNKTAVLALLE